MLFLALIHFIKFCYCVCDVDLLINCLRPFQHCRAHSELLIIAADEQERDESRIQKEIALVAQIMAQHHIYRETLLLYFFCIFQKEYLNKLSCLN